jgi:hypothetical protein
MHLDVPQALFKPFMTMSSWINGCVACARGGGQRASNSFVQPVYHAKPPAYVEHHKNNCGRAAEAGLAYAACAGLSLSGPVIVTDSEHNVYLTPHIQRTAQT